MALYAFWARQMGRTLSLACAIMSCVGLSPTATVATTIAPPMLDISRQCDTHTRRNATAMSECVVAESEARSELLQKWGRVSDASAEKCLKLGKKARKFPYSAMAKCLAIEPVEVQAPQAVPPPSTAEAQTGKPECKSVFGFPWIKSLRHGC